MANAALFVGWGQIVRGREVKSIEVFNAALTYYGRLQAEGTLESFEPVILQAHGGELSGFILLRGERATLSALVGTEEFQQITVRANLIVENLGVVNASIGTELTEGIGRFLQAATALGV